MPRLRAVAGRCDARHALAVVDLRCHAGPKPHGCPVSTVILFPPSFGVSQTISMSFTSPLLPRSWFGENEEVMKQEKGFIVIVYFLGWCVPRHHILSRPSHPSISFKLP